MFFDKLKNIFKFIKENIVFIFGLLIGVLIYIIKAKDNTINSLKAKIDLAETQKQADLIEVEIKQLIEERIQLKKEEKGLQELLKNLEEKRKQLVEKHKTMTESEIEDYWNK